jgi:hypothetical protein
MGRISEAKMGSSSSLNCRNLTENPMASKAGWKYGYDEHLV